jgi:hypothetical protein
VIEQDIRCTVPGGCFSCRTGRTAGVPYIPGHPARRVTDEDQTIRIPRLDTPIRSRFVQDPRWSARGVLAVAAVLALAVITDGGLMILLGWWMR